MPHQAVVHRADLCQSEMPAPHGHAAVRGHELPGTAVTFGMVGVHRQASDAARALKLTRALSSAACQYRAAVQFNKAYLPPRTIGAYGLRWLGSR